MMTKKSTTLKTEPSFDEKRPMGAAPAEILKQAVAPTSQIKVTSTDTKVTGAVSGNMIQNINDQELTSIYALLAYVAHNQNVSQDLVQMILEAEFSVDHASKIRRHDYQRAIEFLVDLRVDEVRN